MDKSVAIIYVPNLGGESMVTMYATILFLLYFLSDFKIDKITYLVLKETCFSFYKIKFNFKNCKIKPYLILTIDYESVFYCHF